MSTFNVDGVMVDIPGIVIDADASDDIAAFVALDAKVDAAEGEGLMARWEFGSRLLTERDANGGKQLPHGRLDAIVEATGKSRAEIQNRVQFAEQYDRSEVPNALSTFGSWYGIVTEGMGTRGGAKVRGEWEAANRDEAILRELGIKVQPYDVWNFPTCHDDMGDDHPGRIPGQIVCHALYFFTAPGDLVVDPMAGSGTTLDACRIMDRRCHGYDIDHRHGRVDVEQHDLSTGWPETVAKAALIFWDPPYYDKMDHATIGTDGYIEGSISGLNPESYLDWFTKRFEELRSVVRPATRLAFLMSDWDPENAKRHSDYRGIYLWDYADRLRDSGWKLRRQIHVPLPTQQVHPDIVNKFRESRRLARLERYLLVAEA